MFQKWTVQYWGEDDNLSCVEKWLEGRSIQQLKAITKEIKLLERCGNMLRLPHSKTLGDGLFELRERTYGYRIYYAFLPGRTIVMLQGGDKKSQKGDMKLSRERLAKMQKQGVTI